MYIIEIIEIMDLFIGTLFQEGNNIIPFFKKKTKVKFTKMLVLSYPYKPHSHS